MKAKNSHIKEKNPRPTIGMLVDWTEEQYQLSMLHGVADFAEEHGLNFLCFEGGAINASYEYEARRNVVYDLVNEKIVDGLVILSPTIGHYVKPQVITKFCERYLPLPLVSIALAMPKIHSVISDNIGGMHDIIAHLIEVHGYRKFAFIKGPTSSQDALERFNSFRDTLLSYNIDPDPNLIVEGNFISSSGAAAVRTLLDERKAVFDVLVACNDDMALGALNEMNARGIKIPADIALVGFDNLDYGVHTSPPLTTVSYSLYTQGWWAAKILMDLIEKKDPPLRTVLPSKLVIRESCGCFAHARGSRPSSQKPHIKDLSFNSAFIKYRHAILTEVVNKTQYFFNNKEDINLSQLIERLLDAFFAEFSLKKHGEFLKTLNEILDNKAWTSGDIFSWQPVITELRYNLQPYLTDFKLLCETEGLWHQVRTLIGEKALTNEKLSHHKSIQANNVLSVMREELLLTLDQKQLADVLMRTMPALDIKSCYLLMFEGKDNKRLRLTLAFNEKGLIDTGEKGMAFFSQRLLPANLLPEGRRFSLLVESFNFSASRLGLIIFEMGPRDGRIYGELRRVICSTLQGATLFKQIQDQADHLRIQKENLSQNLNQLRKVMGGFIKAMALTVETRDPYTAGHQHRVADLARAIATEMKLPRDLIEGIRMAGIVHDLGKIYVPAEILNKPGRLKDMEFDLIKNHPRVAYDILKSIDFPWPIAQIVLQHHERIDGSGYPEGLAGDDISIEAKILSVADVVEAMASHRPYRASLGIKLALEEININSGRLYDPKIVDICIRLFREKGYMFK